MPDFLMTYPLFFWTNAKGELLSCNDDAMPIYTDTDLASRINGLEALTAVRDVEQLRKLAESLKKKGYKRLAIDPSNDKVRMLSLDQI